MRLYLSLSCGRALDSPMCMYYRPNSEGKGRAELLENFPGQTQIPLKCYLFARVSQDSGILRFLLDICELENTGLVGN